MSNEDYTAGANAYTAGEGMDCLHGQSAEFDRGYWDAHNAAADEVRLDFSDCLDHSSECAGAVEYRMAMSPTGKSFARCDHHFEVRMNTQQRLSRNYGVPLYY